MKNSVTKSILIFIISSAFLLPVTTFALQPYTLLVPSLPGIGDGKTVTFPEWLPGAFKLAIAVSAGLAFVMITFGGIMYATTDAVGTKSQGKEYIYNAIVGLLFVLSAWVVLNTINPEILAFKWTIPVPTTITRLPTVAPVGPNGTGCTGDCKYTYTNNGQTISYRDCVSCAPSNSFGLNIKTATADGKPTQMNKLLGQKLKAIQDSGSAAFTVTETWPPTVNHQAKGQYDGTSVDLSLDSPNVRDIKDFISRASGQLRVVYEVSNEAQRQAYIKAGIRDTDIISVGYITNQHFSVYLP